MGNNNTNMYPNDKSSIGAYPALTVEVEWDVSGWRRGAPWTCHQELLFQGASLQGTKRFLWFIVVCTCNWILSKSGGWYIESLSANGPGACKGLIKCKNTFKCSDVMFLYHDRTKHTVAFFVQLPTKAKIWIKTIMMLFLFHFPKVKITPQHFTRSTRGKF